ncbi:hypothetical protein A2960_02575 [Candidatus Gottesmanbacteria bacterium RIFCSPLOWO2_01_FULL_39_12b]|uniref:PIN domain-containing protein n=1 Tax=Candidatus Gottesmanbacteria bacterium RIFCSPLOWO2_01_FULL_39_12b TaxID=1798388 RepID=A0A1F6ARU9_9BACT|nr:MAG: hypothetical protein A2960_02575 [Candidatus Gottesmanbacteria bacterium RIFCSPLOWO2_01_FULL_39_12b]
MTDKTFLFVDSSAWISLVVINDINHQKAVSVFSSFNTKTKLYISFFIINETITKIRKIFSQEKASELFNQYKKLEKEKFLTILPVDRNIIEKGVALLSKHPTPNTFSLTDATNVVLMEKYHIPTLFSFDRDFKKLKTPYLSILP